MLAPAIESQVATLAGRYGAPLRVVAELRGQPVRPLTAEDRTGEVCMVVRRPAGTLLTAIKTYYPAEAFRLLTGGINHGEPIEAALLRETYEETGLHVAVRRFLAVVEYRADPAYAHMLPGPLTFATFAFLLDEVGGTLGPIDASEQVGAFREVATAELPALAEVLENVADGFHPDVAGSWRDWGRFRAVTHRAVHQALAGVDVG